MNWNELINPWGALKRAKLDVVMLRREQVLLVQELRIAQRNDNRGKEGKFKKGEGK
jgi:hypothetical protein